MKYFKLLFIVLLLSNTAFTSEEDQNNSFLDNFSKSEKMIATNLAISSGVIAWGFSQWEYGSESFHTDKEGWFERKTSNGGSDKLGHFYTNYLLMRAIAPLYESWGYSSKEAAIYGALSSELAGLIIEIGDGYSEHGFSTEDIIMDTVGVLVGALWHTSPALSSTIDFRVEYHPFTETDNQTDFTTDYERMKHLMAIKAEGFEWFENTPLEYLELYLGYYTRNFNHGSLPLEGRERNLYVGLGVNLSKLFYPALKEYASIFNYVQLPYSYIEKSNKF